MSNYKYYVGAKFNTEIGGDFEIIEIIDNNNVKIRFSDEFQFEKVISKDSINRGFAKNPFKPTVFGVGYLGVGKYKSICKISSKSSTEYNTWQNMLQRCYYDKYISRIEGTVAYDSVSVCNEWHNFQNFAEWYCSKAKIFKGNIVGRLHVDKDILSKNTSKVYSPETCCLIPQEINTFFIKQSRSKSTSLPSNIIKSKNGYRVSRLNGLIINKEFYSLEDAISFRDNIKQHCLNRFIIKYFDVLEDRVIDALLNYYTCKQT